MKTLLTIFLIFQSVLVFSQPDGMGVHPIKDFKTYGYINGIRLDSVNAGFAKFGWREQSPFFDYGQGIKAKKRILVTDNNGLRLIYTGRKRLFWTNFFDFNGWEYEPGSFMKLLKKRR